MKRNKKEKEKRKEQKELKKFQKHNEKLKKKVDEWRSQRDEKERKQREQQETEEKKRIEEEKTKEQHYEQQKQKIAEYRQQLRQKNNETLQFLRTVKSEKQLGPLKHLKDPSVIEKIDLANDYHLPLIVKTVEMMEEEKHICERFLMKHKSRRKHDIVPRSRRLAKRSPFGSKSRNNLESNTQYSRTQDGFMSPQHHIKETLKVYQNKSTLLLLKQGQHQHKHQYHPKKSVIQEYVEMRSEHVQRQKRGEKGPDYSDDKVATNFMDYNKAKQTYGEPSDR